MGGQPLREERAPVVRSNFVHTGDDIFKRIGNDPRAGVFSAEKFVAKIVQRLLAMGLLANDGVGFKPDQRALIVIVHTATPGGPRRGRGIQDLHRNRCVLQVPPRSSWPVIQISGGVSERFTKERGRSYA
jgi:hypothetical protein